LLANILLFTGTLSRSGEQGNRVVLMADGSNFMMAKIMKNWLTVKSGD